MTISKAKVAIVGCSSYDYEAVERAVERGINLLGGVEKFASKGEKILFKPNVLWPTDPAKCVITHPAVMKAAATIFSRTGAVLQYGDSPAAIHKTFPTMKKSGYVDALSEIPIELVSFENGKNVSFADGICAKVLNIANAILEADGVINLPKLKTHGLTRLTGAVKNLYGCIPGFTKGEYHARHPDVYDFSNLLVDIARYVKPRLHIMDAIEAMEGNGPQSGTPKKLGVLLFSEDPVALDTVACMIIDLPKEFVPTIAAGVKAGLGKDYIEEIEMVGDDINSFIDKKFKVVKQPPVKIPSNPILRNIKRFFIPRPVIIKTRCISCGRCVDACPLNPKAIEKKKRFPVYNYQRCIRCYCCQEVCPAKAIEIKNTLFGHLLPVVPYISLLITGLKTKVLLPKKREFNF